MEASTAPAIPPALELRPAKDESLEDFIIRLDDATNARLAAIERKLDSIMDSQAKIEGYVFQAVQQIGPLLEQAKQHPLIRQFIGE